MVFIDGHHIQLDLMDKGDTEEDKALKHVVKANPKQHHMIGQCKGKEWVGHQQSGHETFLVIIIVHFPTDQKFSESSSQSHHHTGWKTTF